MTNQKLVTQFNNYKPTTTTNMAKKVIKSANPFEIKTDILFTGNHRIGNKDVTSLSEQALKLQTNNKQQSVNIPVNLYPTRSAASNLFLGMKRYITKRGKTNTDIKFVSKSIYSDDKKKTYLGSRIWRVA